MKRSSKRLWSVLLTLAMLLSIAPVSAYAAGTWWGWLGGDTESYSSGSYDAYYYMLLPSFTQGDDSRDTADFNFVGKGSVASYIGLPNGQSKNNTIAINAGNKGYMIVPPVNVKQHFSDGNGNSRNITTYPNVVYDDITYVYRGNPGADSERYTYSIEWYRYSSSPGYNIGDNFSVSPSEYDGFTWHVDGYVKLSDKYTVTYMVKFPGSEEYSNVSAEGEPANNAYVVYVNENSNYTFSQITAPEMEQTLEESGPSGTTVTYRFNGWYYDEGCTSKVDDRAKITDDIVVYGKYVTENVSGSSYLNIKVFLDGVPVALSETTGDPNYWKNYITNVTNVPSTAAVRVDGVDDNGLLKCTFDYTNFNSADLAITPSSSYVLQGVYGTFIYGMYGWYPPKIESTYWNIDNVQGGSTLTVYLSTPYTVQYHLDGPAAELPTDDDVYVAVKGLDDFTAPDFTGLSSASSVEEKNVGKAGGWVDNRLNYELELEGVPTGYTGWYKTDSYKDMHKASYEDTAIATAAGADNVVHCYGKKNTYTVSYQLTSTENPTDCTLPAEASHYAGDSVDVAAPLITDDTEKNGVSGTWAFNGWTSTDVTVTDGKFTMPAKDVKFTGSWKFTANTHSITINYVDEDSGILKTAYSTTQNDGYNYSFTVSSDASGYIPFFINKGDSQYVFDHFAAGSAALSGTLKDDVTITAVYLLDSDNDGTPDAYEATVTYKVVNGTWSNDTSADKTEKFNIKTFDRETNTWKANDPTLGDTIPTGMKPGKDYLSDGASWNTTISPNTEVTGNVTYTYTFRTEKAPGLSVEKSVVSINNVAQPATGTLTAIAGDVIEYKIVITNTGNVPLAGVQVSDSLWTAGMKINVGGKVEQLTDTAYTIGELAVDGSVTISYTYTVTTVKDSGTTLTNTATASASGVEEIKAEATVYINGAVTITPADITIYMGGNGGYDAVVGTDGNATISNSMPRPLFYVSVPEGTDPDNLTLKGNDDREWRFEEAGLDANRVSLFYINSTGYGDQDPVRVQYSRDGEVYVEDEFDPAVVQELYTEYDISIYSGRVTSVWAEFKIGSITTRHSVASETGTLRVRAVEDGGEDKNPVVDVTTMPPAGPLQPGEAAITAPEDTTYTLNDTTVPVNADGVGLLFDSIIDDSDADRTAALIAAIETKYDLSIGSENYQAQYLDLVDAQNGNAWVKASGNVTVYWAYPEGTDENTEFTLYHFTNLHRDGQNSGFDLDDINAGNITEVTVELGEYGIAFDVESGGFSPFVLAWETPEPDEPDGPDIPPYIPPVTPSEPDYKPEWLNTEDHYAYIIGYEDGTVRPYGSITRAETATIFFRLLTDEAREECWTETNSYTDVSRGDWYNTAVSTLSRLGILGGYEDGTFRPNSGITRAEFAKIAVSFFEYEGIEAENVFTDVAHGSWYEDFVAAAAEIGLIEGYEDGSFRPESGITRAEACTIINRTLGRAPDKGHLLPESEMLTWPDNPESAWYYAQIQEATNSHEYKWLGDIEQWLEKLPERDWAELE